MTTTPTETRIVRDGTALKSAHRRSRDHLDLLAPEAAAGSSAVIVPSTLLDGDTLPEPWGGRTLKIHVVSKIPDVSVMLVSRRADRSELALRRTVLHRPT
jgi:hypothetical protein